MLIIAAILFICFCLDVLIGAITGTEILSNVQAMILLLAASIAFVIETQRREAHSKKK